MKRLLSAFLSIVMVAGVFFCVDLSAYAAGDDDNYTMYQADYYSKNFSFDTPSFSQIYYDELSNDDLFITAVNAWETIHIATSPSYSLESGMITKKDYYKTVIFDLFAQSDSNDGLDNLLDIATNKQLSYAVNVSKAIMEAEDVTAETLNKVTPEKAINLIFGSKYCNIANGASVATKIAEWCQDAKEAVDTFSKYQAIYDLKNGTREFLNYIASDSSNPYELREAASECANYFENGYNEVLNQIIGGVQSIGDFTMKIITDTALDWAWTLIVSSIPGGKAVMIAAKGARALSNYLFSTDKEVEAYYKLEAQVAMENAIKSSVNRIKSSSNITSNLSDAAIYMNAVDGFRKAIILGFDYSIDLLEICANSKFNASTDGLFGSYTQCMNLVNQITNFKTEKENYFKIFENQCLNGYKNKYFPDYDSVLNGVEYQKIPVESISLSLIKDFSAGISGYINDYIKTEYSPSGYTEITMPNWESSNEGIIKFIPDYNGFCGGSFEAVSNGDCTITCSLSSGVSQSITVHVGEKQEEEEHDYLSDFEYRINSDGNTATITDYVGSSTNVLIPAVIDGYAITSIGNYAFQYCYSLIEITIPNSVTSIEWGAFSDCSSLTEIAIPNSVTSIGDSAFSGCSSLTEITIPNSVTSIGDGAFSGCSSLTEITIPNSVTSIGWYAFYGCSSLTEITIPNSVTSIGYDAFWGCYNLENVYYNGSATQWVNISFDNPSSYPNNYADKFYITGNLELEEGLQEIPGSTFENCKSLENITIPNSVTSIGDYAFTDCTSLKSVTIQDSVTSTGNWAFSGCTSLKSVTIQDSVTSIGSGAFYKCTSLTDVTIGNDVTSIGESAFDSCTSLTSVTIPDSVTSIGESAFYKCTSLTDVTIGNGVTSIGNSAFYGCNSLTDIAMPNSVTSIGESAFFYCTSLTDVTIGNGVTSIEWNAFWGCNIENVYYNGSATQWANISFGNDVSHPNYYADKFYITGSLELEEGLEEIPDYTFKNCKLLENVTIPNSVTSIGSDAFYGCSSLTEITIPNSVTSIGSDAFYGCSSLTEITIPDSVTSIGSGTFYGCSSLTEITIPDCVTSIGNSAFYGCSNLTEITIPDCVTSIGSGAFYGCSSLTEITIPDCVTSIGDSTFYGCCSLTEITIPNSVTSIGYRTFSGCSSLTEITISSSVTSIGMEAFYGCSSLTEITIPDCVTSIGDSAFYGCSSLTEITIPNSVTSIGYRTFFGCSSLTQITIPSSVTSIEWDAFFGCSSLSEITIPNSVTSIGSDAFCNCSNLKELTIPESVTSIGEGAFLGCNSLENVYYNGSAIQWINISFGSYGALPNLADNFYITGSLELEEGLQEIPDSIFANCKSLENVTIPNSVTSIGSDAFYGCSSLTEITIPDSVTSIGSGAFYGCSSLTEITIPDCVTSIGQYAFLGCTSLTDVAIPNSVTSIGNGAFYGCTSLTSVTIPDSVTSIDIGAFYGCSSLTSVTIPDSVTSIGDSAFFLCDTLENVYYSGSKKDWENISIGSDNSSLTNATIHFAKELSENIEDIETGIVVSENTGEALPENTELIVKEISPSGNGIKYDISLQKDGEEIQPNGNVTVKIPVPKNMDGFACKVYRQEADNTYTDMNATYQDGYMVFVTDHFSVYILTTGNPDDVDVVLGDVNGDGIVDAADAVMVQRYDAGLITLQDAQLIAADVTGDGTVDAADAVKIQRYDAGLISSV